MFFDSSNPAHSLAAGYERNQLTNIGQIIGKMN
jgi:hypothetical protein